MTRPEYMEGKPMTKQMTAEVFRKLCAGHDVHTVEIAVADTFAHLRGKRVPVGRFFDEVVDSGAAIADAVFILNVRDELIDHEFVNMEIGFLDTRLVPDVSTGRLLTHRPGYALVFCDSYDEEGAPHHLSPRAVLAAQIERCRILGLGPVVATELEFYLCVVGGDGTWQPVRSHIKYCSLTDAIDLEEALCAMRVALAGAGLIVESSNQEYGPCQIEINHGPADAMRAADDCALYRSIVKQVAEQHGLRATFMPKPFTEESGSGMHVHTSLREAGGGNAFADSDGAPNKLMGHWVAGLLEHATAMSLLGAPTANGPRRIRPYTFAPTHVHWGLDNRSVLARCIVDAGSKANRVEFRSAGADANPYLLIAGVLAAGCDGIERSLALPTMSVGDMYASPGECVPLPADLAGAIDAFDGSPLASMLGDTFSRSFVSLAREEVRLATEHNPAPDEVNDWERARYLEFS